MSDNSNYKLKTKAPKGTYTDDKIMSYEEAIGFNATPTDFVLVNEVPHKVRAFFIIMLAVLLPLFISFKVGESNPEKFEQFLMIGYCVAMLGLALGLIYFITTTATYILCFKEDGLLLLGINKATTYFFNGKNKFIPLTEINEISVGPYKGVIPFKLRYTMSQVKVISIATKEGHRLQLNVSIMGYSNSRKNLTKNRDYLESLVQQMQTKLSPEP
ncbi:hypothetical protein PT285_00545 [Lactobacillus sp. ESL0791]|uniref:hypothetical protein n=1 Tax=Lactobacillus sp. ESL0791 TaxID=2983234 RepID=UPI0023F6F4F4|nr:hypothetical protein [Lactobacillus sp. ESL0791]MDF7637928.1 hypothetical protein [Lactobacillus sp. ESL0791]